MTRDRAALATWTRSFMCLGWLVACNAPVRGDWPLPGANGMALPEGAAAPELALSDIASMAVDDSGAVWLTSRCHGVYAVDGDEVRRYDSTNSPLPAAVLDVAVDGVGRRWFRGDSSTTVWFGGHWQRVHEGVQLALSTAPDGSVWLLSDRRVRRLAPGPNRSYVLPEPATSLAAVSRNSLWLATSGGVYFGEKNRWVGPIATDGALVASPSEPYALLLAAQSYRLDWTGEAIEARELDLPPARPLGFDRAGRLVALDDTHVYWIAGGAVESSVALGGFQVAVAALAPDDSVLVATGLGTQEVFRVTPRRQGVALRTVPFLPERDYPWRARGLAAALATPSLDVSAEQLLPPSPELHDVKLRVLGHVEVGASAAAVVVDGQDVAWPLVTVQLDIALGQRGLHIAVPRAESVAPGDDAHPEWELYGYLESAQCGPWGSTRQLWITEAYPATWTSEQRHSLRSELAASVTTIPSE